MNLLLVKIWFIVHCQIKFLSFSSPMYQYIANIYIYVQDRFIPRHIKEVRFCNEQEDWRKLKNMTIWSLHWRAISSRLNSYLAVQLFTTNVKNNNVGCHRLCKTFKWHCSLDNIRGDFEYFLTHAISFEEMLRLKPSVKKCYIHKLHSFCIYFSYILYNK